MHSASSPNRKRLPRYRRTTLDTAMPLSAADRSSILGSSREGRGDGVRRFGESAGAAGGLGRFPGCELMPLVQRFLRTAAAT